MGSKKNTQNRKLSFSAGAIWRGVCRFFRWLFVITSAPLYKVPLFWLSVFIPLALAFYFAQPLFAELSYERSEIAYKTFVEVFSFPLWIASGSILFGIIIGRFHGSAQRHEAIQQTASNNNFHNYIEHRRIFDSSFPYTAFDIQLHNTEEPTYRVNLNRDRLYQYFFPFNSYTNFDIRLESNSQYLFKNLHDEYGETPKTLTIDDLAAAYIKYQSYFPTTLYVDKLGVHPHGLALNFIVSLEMLYRIYPKISSIGLREAEELNAIKKYATILKLSKPLLSQHEHPSLMDLQMLMPEEIEESEGIVRVR